MFYKISVIVPTLTNEEGVTNIIKYFLNKDDFQLIIIDNKPEIKKLDKNITWNVERGTYNFKNIVYLPQERNLGYARANNLGAKYAKAEWLLLLNDDIKFKIQNSNLKSQNDNLKLKIVKNPINELLKIAKENNLDAVAPILINPDGSVENYGYRVMEIGKIELVTKNFIPLDTVFSRRLHPLKGGPPSHRLRKQVSSLASYNNLDGLTAACLLIKRSVFEKLGGFDESFFAYLEDVDLFLRLKKAGYKFALVSDIVVFHHHRKTSLKMGCFKQRQDVVNWWRLFFKHPDIIRFSPAFLVERARNVWGLIKCVMCNV